MDKPPEVAGALDGGAGPAAAVETQAARRRRVDAVKGIFKTNWPANNAEVCAVAVVVAGFVLCALSIMIGVFTVTFDGKFRVNELATKVIAFDGIAGKEVGYLAALNWSFYGVLVLPVIVLTGLLAFRNMETTLRGVAARGMIRKSDTLAPVSPEEYLAEWRRTDLAWRTVLIVVAILSGGFIMWDGIKVVTAPIWNPSLLSNIQLGHTDYEYDWSIATLFNNPKLALGETGTSRIAQTFFDILAYMIVPGLSTVFAFVVAVISLRFMAFVGNRGATRRGWIIVLDASQKENKLFGWNEFEQFFSCLLYWSLAVLFGLWLMVVQNAYLRADDSPNIVSFLFSDSNSIVGSGWQEFLEKLAREDGVDKTFGEFTAWLFADPSSVFFANTQWAAAILVYGFVCSFAVFGSWWMLRVTARKSRQTALEHIDKVAPAAGLTAQEFKERVRKMKIWPIGWIDQWPLFGLLIFMFASLVSYRLMLIPIVYAVLFTVSRIFKSIKKMLSPRDDTASDLS
jgi:hypothetical protein